MHIQPHEAGQRLPEAEELAALVAYGRELQARAFATMVKRAWAAIGGRRTHGHPAAGTKRAA